MLRTGLEPIPGYRLLSFIGRGNFGEVWKASGPGGVSVALKFISLEQGRGGLKEFRAVQQIRQVRHIHLVQVFGIWATDQDRKLLTEERLQQWAEEITGVDTTRALGGNDATRPTGFIVAMQLAEKNLFDRLTECKEAGLEGIPIEELLGYMADAAKALDFLNTPQHPDPADSCSMAEPELVWISHSDIKPQNIVLCRDAAQVCDFGLARVMRSSLALTTYAGAPAYSAPECFKSGPSRTSDQYSLAITYLQLRTGSLPFREGATVHEVVAAHTQGNLDLSRLSRRERSVIAKATALDHSKRFAASQTMVTQLREAIKDPPPPAWKKFAATAVLATCVTALCYYVAAGLRPSQIVVIEEETPGKAEPPAPPAKPSRPKDDVLAVPKPKIPPPQPTPDVKPPPVPPSSVAIQKPPAGRLRAGQSLKLTLVGTGTFEYRVAPEKVWKPAPGGKVNVENLLAGKLRVEARALDARQNPSPVAIYESVVEPPVNHPPTLEIAGSEPSEPVPGQPFTINLRVSDPDQADRNSVKIKYSSAEEGDWRPVDGTRLVIENPTVGDLRLSFVARDARGAESAPVNRTWHLRQPSELTNSIGAKLVRIEAGRFLMGSPTEEEGRRPDERQHEVQISRPFYMATTEVTQKQYAAVMHVNPSYFGANNTQAADERSAHADYPVERVSWKDAVKFCGLLSASTVEQAAGRKYRLPTEEEWEYACRAGSTTAYFTGNRLALDAANFLGLARDAGPDPRVRINHPIAVAGYAPNQFGLFDMAGNVYEWCADWYSEDFDAAKAGASRTRVTRGGGFRSSEKACRSASRRPQSPDDTFNDTGFRVVCELQSEARAPASLSTTGVRLGRASWNVVANDKTRARQ